MAIIKYALRKFRVMTSINNCSRDFCAVTRSELLGELQMLNVFSISQLKNLVCFGSPQILPLKPVSSLNSLVTEIHLILILFSSSLQWLYLDDIYFCLIVFTAVINLLSVITGDNKNDRGRAESHFLLWPVPCFLRHNYWSYWFVTPCCWCLFHCPLESHQAKAQELQKAASKLQERMNRMMFSFLSIHYYLQAGEGHSTVNDSK